MNFGFGFGGWGRVGWLPCGPGDWYHPWYGGWGGRYNAVGIGEFGRFHEGFSPLGNGRFSNFGRAFGDERVRSGFSSMAGSEFGRGAVSMHQERISEASFRQASVMTGRMPVSPSRESFSPTNREASPSTIRNGSSGSQRFFSSSHAGFSSQSAGPRGNNAVTGQAGGRGFNSPAGGDSRGGWNRFTPSSGAQAQPQSAVRGYSSPNAQRQFDSPTSASRGGYGGSSNSYNRSPLNMRQPIVTPRGGYNGSGYNSPRGRYSAPSAPRGNSSGGGSGSYRGGGGGGGHSGGHSR